MKGFQAGLLLPAYALIALGTVAVPVPAAGQSADLYELTDRLDRLQREVQTLQRTISRGAAAGRAADSAANTEVRLTEFEALLRGLEQRIEALENERRRDSERLEQLSSDLQLRLQALEQAAPAPDAADAAAAPGIPNPSIIGGTAAPDAPPRPLGTLKLRDAPAAAKPAPRPAAPLLPAGTAKEQYDYALSLTLKDADYAKAGTAFRAFIDKHPKHQLTGNAYFWLGRTYFVRKDFENASFAFADGYRKFPRGPKAPDSLYNLGVSLRHLGKKREACTALARLLDEFPNVNRTLKTRVSRQRKRLKCG